MPITGDNSSEVPSVMTTVYLKSRNMRETSQQQSVQLFVMVPLYSALTYFRMKCIRVAIKTSPDRPQPIDLVIKIISTAAAVAAIAELTISKTVTIPTYKQHRQSQIRFSLQCCLLVLSDFSCRLCLATMRKHDVIHKTESTQHNVLHCYQRSTELWQWVLQLQA